MKNIDEFGQYVVDNWFSSTGQEDNHLRTLFIMTTGLAGETGEVCEKLKKFIRDNFLDKDALKKELGDVIHYWARICREFDMQPSDVIATNISKCDG
jgi:NTP pyrophosphatase (non-canonical NTP hydrolase)